MYRRLKFSHVDLSADGWTLQGVRVLTTSVDRYIGIGSQGGSPVMLLTRSIHTFTVGRSLSIIVVDRSGVVLSVSVIRPRRIIAFRAQRWVIETEAGMDLPTPGTQIVASTMPSRCPAH
jgi:hypothetical protein